MRDRILKDLPNFPIQVVDQWLVPFAEDEGWPPGSARWRNLLFVTDLGYWRHIEWTLQVLDLLQVPFTLQALQQLQGLYESDVLGEENAYSRVLGAESVRRYDFHRAHLESNLALWSPPVLVDHACGNYDIMDGNHRLLAYCEVAKVIDIPAQEMWIGVSPNDPAPFLD